MKIIVANYRYFIAGGPEKYMFNFIDACQKNNIEVIPFSVNNKENFYTPYKKYFAKPRSNELFYKDTKLNIKNIYGMLRATIWNFDAYKKLRKLIRDTKPDVIYILHEINHLSPSIIKAAKKEKIKVVHRISDFFMICPKSDLLLNNQICESCIYGNYKNAIKNKCVKNSTCATLLRVFAMKLYKKKKIFDDVDSFICTCEFTKNKLVEAGYNKSKFNVIPTFIDSTNITPNYKQNNYFLILGRISEQKGIIYAIKAIAILKEYDYKLYITGELSNDRYGELIKKEIKENELENKIVFTGFIKGERLKKIISNCIAVITPAIWYENMPNSVIESFAYGKPVIASKLGSLIEMVDNNKNGFLFKAGDYKELSKKMLNYINDKELALEHGKNARKKCENNYSLNKHMERIIKVFKK